MKTSHFNVLDSNYGRHKSKFNGRIFSRFFLNTRHRLSIEREKKSNEIIQSLLF